MKNLIVTGIALLFLANSISAQEGSMTPSNDLSLGIKGGTNYSNVYDSRGEDFNADPKFGWVAGGFLTIPIIRYVAIQPEVLFSQKGFKATGSLLGSSYSLTRTTNYIDVPLFVVVRPIKALSLMAGPQYSYLLKRKDEFTGGAVNVQQEEEFKNDDIRKNTLCFIGGLDINLSHLVLGARVGWDVKNNNGDGTSTTPNYKNVWFQATVGIKI